MKTFILAIAAAAALSSAPQVFAQTTNTDRPAAVTPPATQPSQAGLTDAEAKFKALLTSATLAGRWCSVKDGQMGPDKEDKYSIESVSKTGGDSWIVNAHVQYGQRDFVAPIPVKIKWAGDAPVLVVNNLTVPGGGTYTARILFFGNTYSGTWSGGDHGGLLHGVISSNKKAPDTGNGGSSGQ